MTVSLLNAIAKWQMEASRENMLEMFYPIPDLPLIIDGERQLVIGRKGAGKTAIAEYIMSTQTYNTFTEKLSFKDFPFHILYALNDDSYRAKSQYISLWKFVIYCSLCRMLARNQNIDPTFRDTLADRFPNDGVVQLNQMMSSWVTRTFGVNILGTGGNLSETRSLIPTSKWWDELAALDRLASSCIDDGVYYILFDALDDDYKEMNTTDTISKYLDLLAGLIKAVSEVNESFVRTGSLVHPIVFLRSDIYDLINDNDKNKWRDIGVTLTWRKD